MKLDSREIEMQPVGVGCTLCAVINLHRARGLAAPTFEGLAQMLPEWKQGTTVEQDIALLERLSFPARCQSASFNPKWLKFQRAILKVLLRCGFHLILGYAFKHPQGGYVQHVVVADGYNDQGFTVLDSAGGYAEDSVIEFEPNPSAVDMEFIQRMKEKYRCGSRRVLPFEPLRAAYDAGAGLNHYFVIVWP
jgi:hypothetical protein